MKDSLIKWLMLLGTVAILGIVSIQTYWLYRTWKLREVEFDQKVRSSLLRVAHDLARMSHFSLYTQKELVQQISTDYYIVNIDHSFDASDLEAALRYHFEAAFMRDNFDYYVYDCASDEMLYCNSITYDGNLEEVAPIEGSREELIYYFGVRFPGRGGFILNSMDMSILFSVLLVLALVFFFFALFIVRRQSRLAKLQTDFINNMTHEFKTPISTINISNQVFLDHPDVQKDPRLLNYAHIIRDQNDRLNRQVEKVLQIAQFGDKSPELKLEIVKLTQMIDQTIEACQAKIEEAHGQILWEPGASEVHVLADKVHVQNLLFNLLDNAIKYSEGKPDISIEIEKEGQGTYLRVKDRGKGIAPEHQKRVFDRFYRVPTGDVHTVKGFGLGLYYVKSICDAHGWSLNIESAEGEGTTISIYFK